MLKSPIFSDQFNKITKAYFADEINPLNPCACFIGNLLNGTNHWAVIKVYAPGYGLKPGIGMIPFSADVKDPEYGFYTMTEIIAMEKNFLGHCYKVHGSEIKVTEEQLFRAVESTLEMLQAIHEAKGEVTGHIKVRRRQLAS